jgi:DNA recombination protein RmuC
MLEPITRELAAVKQVSQEIDKERHASFEMLGAGIQAIQKETERLATALKKPQSRGAWGEMQLELTLTNAGLIEGQDFTKQDSTTAEDGSMLRTDFLLHLPHGRKLVIDCKLPLTAYMDSMNASDEVAREAEAGRHVDAVRGHIRTLSSKSYQDQYPGADCVVLFIPHEGAYNLALERDPNLAIEAEKRKVYLAGPHSILAVVHLARYILNQTRVRDNAEKLSEIGERMIERIATVTENLQSVGKGLNSAIGAYNRTINSVDKRLMPAARQMEALGVKAKKDLPELAQVDELPQAIASAELQPRAELPVRETTELPVAPLQGNLLE